jgi:hypothetical protein
MMMGLIKETWNIPIVSRRENNNNKTQTSLGNSYDI